MKTSFGFSLDLNKFLRLFLIDCGVFFTSLEVSFEAVADKASFPDVCSVDSVECELLKIKFSSHNGKTHPTLTLSKKIPSVRW